MPQALIQSSAVGRKVGGSFIRRACAPDIVVLSSGRFTVRRDTTCRIVRFLILYVHTVFLKVTIMAKENVQSPTVNTVRHGSMFEEMQREDFLAMAAALRRFSACQPLMPVQDSASCFARESRLVSLMES